nr:ATP-dependent helicase HrpB [Oceanococcus sp. HetDA_MAG_MS8]
MRADFATGLPIAAYLPTIVDTLGRERRLILQAEPGAGKTTTVALALLQSPWLQGQVWLTQPRRLAARAAAARLAVNAGDKQAGGLVGLQTRDQTVLAPTNRVVVMTEGVLVQRIQQDPELSGVGAVLLDEFHERSLQADLALALCSEVSSSLREDLALGLMSATLQGQNLEQRWSAPHVHCPGRCFPLRYHHRPHSLDQALEGGLRQVVLEAIEQGSGSVLVFLPGEREIAAAARSLQSLSTPIFPLYARLKAAEQQAALQTQQRRIILATAVAETSLTVQGVNTVIDLGWSRYAEYDPRAGYSRLVTRRVTQAQAEQRAGRAGRIGPGQVFRLWPQDELLPPALAPEVQRADLSPLAMELARWGSAELPWLEPPHPGRLQEAQQRLRQWGALESTGRLTQQGAAMARWGVDPRWASLLEQGHGLGSSAEQLCLLAIAAIGTVDLPLPQSLVDLEEILQAWADQRLSRVQRSALDQALRRLRGRAPREWGSARSWQLSAAVRQACAHAFVDRIGQQRGGAGRFKLSGGGGAVLRGDPDLAEQSFLVVLDISGGPEGQIRRALRIRLTELEAASPEHIAQQEHLRWDPTRGQLQCRREHRLLELVLSQNTAPLPSDAERLGQTLLQVLVNEAADQWPWTPQLRQLQARVAWARAQGLAWPDCSDAVLRAEAQDWLAPFLRGMSSLEQLRSAHALEQGLGFRLQQVWSELQGFCPSEVTIHGRSWPLDYLAPEGPVLAIPVQQMFGLATGPQVGPHQCPILLHLLSPARRPLAVTRDLGSFWAGAWKEVRAQMRGRYPKHDWPERPELAKPPEPRRRR